MVLTANMRNAKFACKGFINTGIVGCLVSNFLDQLDVLTVYLCGKFNSCGSIARAVKPKSITNVCAGWDPRFQLSLLRYFNLCLID